MITRSVMPLALSWLVSLLALASTWNAPSCTTSRLPPTADGLCATVTGALVGGAETGVGGGAPADGSVEAVSALCFIGFGALGAMATGAAEASWVAAVSSADGGVGPWLLEPSANVGIAACKLADGVGSAGSSDVLEVGSGTI